MLITKVIKDSISGLALSEREMRVERGHRWAGADGSHFPQLYFSDMSTSTYSPHDRIMVARISGLVWL